MRVAIGEQLKRCPRVITLGVRPQMADYTRKERELLLAADTVFYPTARFVDLFATVEKVTYPSANCYRLQGDRLKQTSLLRLLNVAHPRTRVYYGHKQKREILEDFALPFVAKKPFGWAESGHIFFINHPDKLAWYNQRFNPAYIQDYIPADRELRVIVVNYHTILGYWRKTARGDLKADPLHSEVWQMDDVPTEVATVARQIAWGAGLSDVAVDMIYNGRRNWVLELNFRYGEESWARAEKDRLKVITEMIERGEL